MTQEQLAEKLETKKSVISRMIKSFFGKIVKLWIIFQSYTCYQQ